MSNKSLREQIRGYYNSHTPDAEHVEQWMAMVSGATKTTQIPKIHKSPELKRRLWLLSGLIALCALLLFSTMLFWLRLRAAEGALGKMATIEAVQQHYKRKPPLWKSSSYKGLVRKVGKAGLKVVAPALSNGQYAVTGARPCSLLGYPAVQVQLRNQYGSRLTLYEVPVTGAITLLQPGNHKMGSIAVRIWREEAMMFALVGP